MEPAGPLEDARRLGELGRLTAGPWMKEGHTFRPEHYFPELRDEPVFGPPPRLTRRQIERRAGIRRQSPAEMRAAMGQVRRRFRGR